jgi:hypothetical protein
MSEAGNCQHLAGKKQQADTKKIMPEVRKELASHKSIYFQYRVVLTKGLS